MRSFQVIGIGACAVDYLGIVPEFPRPDTKNQMKRFIRQGGGPVATALVALARLGASVSYFGKLGSDELSTFVLDDFVREGVDIGDVIKEEGAGPYFAFIVVDEKSGNRTIWWTDEEVPPIKPGEIKEEVIAKAKYLLIDEYQFETALRASQFARQSGVKVVLDAETPDKCGMDELIRMVDFLIVPHEFASGFTGDDDLESSAKALLDLGPGAVVITLGAEGSFCKTAGESFRQAAFQVKAVDTTGCGDVFHGSFIYGLLQNWSLKVVTEFASAVAALNCRKLGGRAAAPTQQEVRDFLLKTGSMKIKEAIEVQK